MVKTETKLIGPELAARLLENNTMNRNMSPRRVSEYADAMQRGQWQQNGQPIVISDTGTLLDGQHRLQAIITCGKPQWILIATGVKEEAFPTIDRGGMRPPSDVLKIAGYYNTAALAAACSYMIAFKQNGNGEGLRIAPTANDILVFVDARPGLSDSAKIAYACRSKFKAVAPGEAAAFHHMFSLVDKTKAAEFFEMLGTGENLYANHPVLQLRNKLVENMIAKRPAKKRERRAWYIKAWNYFRKGKKLHRLYYSDSEQYPQIEGLDYSEI